MSAELRSAPQRSVEAIKADLAVIASREWLSKYDDERIYRLASDAGPLLARAEAAEARVAALEAVDFCCDECWGLARAALAAVPTPEETTTDV